MAALAVLLILAAPIATPNPRNASADAVAAESRALGIDFLEGRDGVEHPSNESAHALYHSGAGAFVDAVIQSESDRIADPPASLRDFLQKWHEVVWAIVGALEKDVPDWGPDADGTLTVPLLPIIRLQRLLVATALLEEHDGNGMEAGRALEAAWSLGRSISSRPLLLPQLLRIAVERMQIGALRRMQAPAPQWLGRLSADGPWSQMLVTLKGESRFQPPGSAAGAAEFMEVRDKALTAVAGALGKQSPCDLAAVSDEEIWRPAAAALAAETNATKRSFADFYAENQVDVIAGFVRRSARLEVDRELTLRVVQLRLQRSASREDLWPAVLVDATSAVCPEARYGYSSSGTAVELRFEGRVDSDDTGPVLPLAFRSRSAVETPPRTSTPALTPTPEGGMIARQ